MPIDRPSTHEKGEVTDAIEELVTSPGPGEFPGLPDKINPEQESSLSDIPPETTALPLDSIEKQFREHDLVIQKEMHGERVKYANKIFKLVCWWLVFIALCFWFSALHIGDPPIQFLIVSEKVMITLLTTTTINVLGLFIVVANWLFPKVPGKKNDELEKK